MAGWVGRTGAPESGVALLEGNVSWSRNTSDVAVLAKPVNLATGPTGHRAPSRRGRCPCSPRPPPSATPRNSPFPTTSSRDMSTSPPIDLISRWASSNATSNRSFRSPSAPRPPPAELNERPRQTLGWITNEQRREPPGHPSRHRDRVLQRTDEHRRGRKCTERMPKSVAIPNSQASLRELRELSRI